MKRPIIALFVSLLVGSVYAQTAGAPLNLKLPPSGVPVSSSTVATPASSPGTKPASSAPGVYYGDTSGRTGNAFDPAPPCDDSTFNQTQVHGSVSTGIATGSHMGTGMWNAGDVNISKRLGSCDEPGGSINFSIGVGTSSGFRGSRYGY